MGRKKDLTIEEVRAEPGFENVTDEQAIEIIETLKTFSVLAYEYMVREQNNLMDENDDNRSATIE